MDRFKIRVAIDISEAQGIAELNRAISIMQAKLKGIKVNVDTSKARAEMDKLNKSTGNYSKSADKATKKTKDYKKSTDEATKGNQKFGQTLTDKVMKFAIWSAIATAIYGTINAIKEAIVTVMDLETSMAKFEIVADATEGQLSQVDTQVDELVSTLGALKTEVTNTATEFARAGFNIQDSMNLAEQAIIGARTGFTDLSHVSQTLIVTLRAFNLETAESKNIINDLFVASKTAAVTFEDLGEGLKRSANSMAIAGASFEQTISMISAANETVQDASKVGSALKTISSRLRGIDSASNLPKLTGQMERFGVSIEDGAGGFRNIYDIMQDLSVAFKNSSDQFAKQAILESLAGKRRANILSGLINNWEKAEQVRDRALNSSEEAEQAQQRLLETSNGQIELMAGNWQIFVDRVLDSDTVLNTLKFINNRLSEINKALNPYGTFEQMNKDIAKTGYMLGVFSDEYISKASDKQEKLTKTINNGTVKSLKDLREEISSAKNDYEQYIGALERSSDRISKYKKELSDLSKSGRPSAQARIDQLKEMIEYEESAKQSRVELLRQSTVALVEMGISASDAEVFIESINEKIDEMSVNSVDKIEDVSEALFVNSSEFEWYSKRFEDLTDDQKSEMESLLQADMDTTSIQIQNSKDRIEMIKSENNIYSASITDRINAMATLEGAEAQRNEQMIMRLRQQASSLSGGNFLAKALEEESGTLDSLQKKYKNISKKYNNFFGDEPDSSGTGSSKSEPLSQLAMDIKEIQHEISLLDDELKRTDGYDKQIEITNKLIGLKEDEKLKLIELRDSQEAEYKSLEDGSEARQDAIADYYKTVEALGKLENDIYGYEESIKSLGDTQAEVLEQSTSQAVSDMRDEYSKMFDDLKEGYKDEADEFEKEQDRKIRVVEKTLDRLRDKYDSEDFVDEEQKIQDKILALEEERQKLSIDNSTEAKKRKSDINKELVVEEDNLSELRQERERDLTIEGLEDKKESYEEETRAYKENLDERLKELESFQEQVMNNLDKFEGNWADFGSDLGTAFKNGLLPSLETINSELAKTIASYNEISGEDIKTPSTDRDVSSGSSSSEDRGIKTRYVDPSGNIRVGYIKDGKTTTESGGELTVGSVVETAGGNYQKTASGSRLRNDIDIDDYIRHDGGIVGGQSFKNGGFMDYMSKMSGNEMPIIAERGEVVITESDIGDISSGMGKIESLITIKKMNVKASNGYDVENIGRDLVRGAKKEYAKKGL